MSIRTFVIRTAVSLAIISSSGIVIASSTLKASAQESWFAIQNRYGTNLCLTAISENTLALEPCGNSGNDNLNQKWEAEQHYLEWNIVRNKGNNKCLWYNAGQLFLQECERNTSNDKQNLWKGIGDNIFAGSTQNVKLTVWASENNCLTHGSDRNGNPTVFMESCVHIGSNTRQDWRRISW